MTRHFLILSLLAGQAVGGTPPANQPASHDNPCPKGPCYAASVRHMIPYNGPLYLVKRKDDGSIIVVFRDRQEGLIQLGDTVVLCNQVRSTRRPLVCAEPISWVAKARAP